MRLERTKNSIRSIAWGLANRALVIVFPFIIRTIIIHQLGAEYAGLNSLFSAVLKVLNMAELGFAGAVSFSMYKPAAEEDVPKMCALMQFYRRLYTVTGCIVLAVGIAAVPFLDRLVEGSVPANTNLYVLYGIYLLETATSYFIGAYRSVLLSVHQRNDIASKINSGLHLVTYALQISLLLVFKNYYLYILLDLAYCVVYNILVARRVSIMYPNYRCKGKLPKGEIRDILKNVYAVILFKVCGVIRSSLDNVFISAMMGLTATAIFGNYFFVISALTMVQTVVQNAIKGGIGNSIVTKSKEENYREMNKFILIYAWFSGLCTALLIGLYQPFIKLWMGPELMVDNMTMVLFCAYFYMMTVGSIRYIYHQCSGLYYHRRYWTVAEALMNLVGNYFFIQLWGMKGILISTILSMFVVDFLYSSRIVFDYYFQNRKINQYYLRHLFYMLITAVACAASYFLCELIQIEGILAILVRAIVCFVVSNFIFLAAYSRMDCFPDAVLIAKKSNKIIKKMLRGRKAEK